MENKVDPIVASLTPSQKRQIRELYGGGNPQSGGKWEPIPSLTLEQINMVMAEQNSQCARETQYAPHDHRTTQSGMYRHQQPFSPPRTVSIGASHDSEYYRQPHSVYPPPAPYHQPLPPKSYPPAPLTSSPPSTGGHHATHSSGVNLTSNLFSLGSIDNSSMATNNDYAIMIIGVTGSGKSTACNFFINEKVFNTKGGAVSVTVKSDAHTGIVLGKKILFIDTPGFSDAYETEEQRMADLGRALYYAQAGVHAIVICFNGTARFDLATEGVVNALDQLGTFWPHAFVLYSHADDMGSTENEQKQQVYEWLNNPRCPERLKWLLEQVQYRFMTVESRMRGGDHSYHQQKCKELVNLVEQVFMLNNHQLYTNKLFKWAKQKYDQARKEKKRQEEELKKCQESLMEHQQLLRSFEEQSIMQTISHQETIDNLQEEIKSLQQQHQQSHFPQEREELYKQILQKQLNEQDENRQLKSIIQEQRETMEEIRQTVSMQMKEQSKLEHLQSQSVMEQYLKGMQEDMRAIKAENKELRDKLMDTEMQKHKEADYDSDDGLAEIAIKGATTGAKEIIDRGAKYFTKNCSLM